LLACGGICIAAERIAAAVRPDDREVYFFGSLGFSVWFPPKNSVSHTQDQAHAIPADLSESRTEMVGEEGADAVQNEVLFILSDRRTTGDDESAAEPEQAVGQEMGGPAAVFIAERVLFLNKIRRYQAPLLLATAVDSA